MKLNLGYIRSGKPIHDNLLIEFLGNMMGFPLDLIDEKDREKYFICLEFEDAVPGHLKLSVDGKKSTVFDKGKYIQVFRAFSGLWDDDYRENDLIQPPKITALIFDLIKHVRMAYKDQELPLIQKWFWPQGKSHAICITHDIDFLVRMNLRFLSKRISGGFLRKILVLRALDRFLKTNFSATFGDNISRILEIEKNLKLKSTFFIFSNLKEYKELAPDEQITDDHFKNLKKTLSNAYEVGLHGSTFSFKNPDQLIKEKNEIKTLFGDVKGVRQHRLNFLPPLTWEYQFNAGFEYDSTYSHNDYFGFRSGICHPYRPVNPLQMRIIDILEIPLSFMDWIITYRKIDFKKALYLFRKLNGYCKRYSGVLVINFHNIYFDPKLFPSISSFIRRILRDVSITSAWKPTLGELCNWWKKRKHVRLNITQKRKLEIELKTKVPINNLCIDVGQKEFISLNFEKEFTLTI